MARSLQNFLLLSIVFVGGPAVADIAADEEAFFAAYREYQEADSPDQAVAPAKIALEIGRLLYGEQSKDTANLSYNYGFSLVASGNKKDGRIVLLETLALFEAVYGTNSAEAIPLLMKLGSASATLFEPKQQKEHYDHALRLAHDHYGPKSDRYGRLLLKAGTGLMDLSRSPLARKYLRDAYKVLNDALGTDNDLTRKATLQLARYEIAGSRYLKAEKYLLSLVETFDDPHQPVSKFELGVHAALVAVYQNRGNPDKAVMHCQAIGRMTEFDEDHDYIPLFRQAPKYPLQALRQGKEGYAIVEFTVDRGGAVRDAKATKVYGHRTFEKAAIEAASAFRYAPRFLDGKPIPTENVRTKISFKLMN